MILKTFPCYHPESLQDHGTSLLQLFYPKRVRRAPANGETFEMLPIEGEDGMTDVDERNTNELDELGPVDWMVVEFPGSKFNGKIAPALTDLVERDLIRVLDLLVLKKDTDGSLEAFELADLEETEIGELRTYEAQLAMLLSEDDVTAVANAIEPGSSAAVLVWENTWAAPFASAVRQSGGQLVASGRIPTQAILAAIEAEEEALETEGT
jgi:Family of unknown function (DUF6325)